MTEKITKSSWQQETERRIDELEYEVLQLEESVALLRESLHAFLCGMLRGSDFRVIEIKEKQPATPEEKLKKL